MKANIDPLPILIARSPKFLDLTNINIIAACIGGFTVVFCVISFFLKEGLFISEPLPAVIFGLIFNQAGWINPDPNNESAQSLNFSRFVLGLQLMIVGVQLPAKYLYRAWKSIVVLLIGAMGLMWLASSIIMFLLIPRITFLEALIIAACITPTDPVLSNSIVSGPFAEKFVSIRLRRIIIAEAGANDGFGYPFLFLALSIYQYSGTEIARQWLLHTVLYQIILSVVYGAVVGYIGQELVSFANKKSLIDKESYILSVFGLALFIVGTAGMIGTDDLLACFIAGNFFTWNDEFRIKTRDDMVQPTVDLALNLGIFIWIGATMPWNSFVNAFDLWRFVVMGIAILLFRRLPCIIMLYKITPEIANFKEALFAGFFGPIGVGALFYLEVCLNQLKDMGYDDENTIVRNIKPVVYFCILSSVVVHGISIPVLQIFIKTHERVTKSRRVRSNEVFSKSTTAEIVRETTDELHEFII